MTQEFIPYEPSLALKELGFDKILCYGFYFGTEDLVNVVTNSQHKTKNKCLAPLYQQAFRWFREKYNINFTIITNYAKVDSKMIKSYRVGITFVKNNMIDSFFLRPKNNTFKFIEFKTYEKAELACLKKLIEIIKNK